jgi:peptide deformylase
MGRNNKMKLELLDENNPLLLQPSTPWNFAIDGNPTELVEEMTRILEENGAVGLAAPQCGVHKTIFIMGNISNLVVCINPKIIALSESRSIDIEGCLSFPKLWLNVPRATGCMVSYQNTLGELVDNEFTGLMARVFLHELDHLLGITFDQRIGAMKLKMAKESRKKTLKKNNRNAKKYTKNESNS